VALVAVQVGYTGGGPALSALGQSDVLRAIWLSVWTSLAGSLAALLLAVPTGYALARWRFPGAWLIEALLLIPVTMSPIALGVALLLLFRNPPGAWLARFFVFEVPGIILAQFFVAYALIVLVIRATIAGIDVRLEQVARFLGCSPWQAFRRVTLPLARNGIVAGFVLGWTRAIGDFGSTSTLAGGVKGYTETMPVAIYLNMASVSIDRAVAMSVVLTLLTIGGLVAVRLLFGGRR
jgi:molybdate transport system permease protein